MPNRLDPYHEWLGISRQEQPPHYYLLLGIEPFERDPETINAAADERMVRVKHYQITYPDHSQNLLNAISRARVCLLDVTKKAAYDLQLRLDIPALRDFQPLEWPRIELEESPTRNEYDNPLKYLGDEDVVVPGGDIVETDKPVEMGVPAVLPPDYKCPSCGKPIKTLGLEPSEMVRCPVCARTAQYMPPPQASMTTPPALQEHWADESLPCPRCGRDLVIRGHTVGEQIVCQNCRQPTRIVQSLVAEGRDVNVPFIDSTARGAVTDKPPVLEAKQPAITPAVTYALCIVGIAILALGVSLSAYSMVYNLKLFANGYGPGGGAAAISAMMAAACAGGIYGLYRLKEG